jgi:hypothetical protein
MAFSQQNLQRSKCKHVIGFDLHYLTLCSIPINDANERRPSRQDSGYVSARGSYSGHDYNHITGQGVANQFISYGENRAPPPPPAYPRKHQEGQLESPISDGSTISGQQHAWGGHDEKQDSQPATPLTPTSAELLGLLPNGRKPESQRQLDDVTPKLRRRQPKVADAYRLVLLLFHTFSYIFFNMSTNNRTNSRRW